MSKIDPEFYVQPVDGERFVTVNEAAKLLRYGRDFVVRRIRAGDIVAYRPDGKHYLVPISSILAWVHSAPCVTKREKG